MTQETKQEYLDYLLYHIEKKYSKANEIDKKELESLKKIVDELKLKSVVTDEDLIDTDEIANILEKIN